MQTRLPLHAEKSAAASLLAVVTGLTVLSLLKAYAYRYSLVGNTLHIREGLLDRSQRHIPVVRIQADAMAWPGAIAARFLSADVG